VHCRCGCRLLLAAWILSFASPFAVSAIPSRTLVRTSARPTRPSPCIGSRGNACSAVQHTALCRRATQPGTHRVCCHSQAVAVSDGLGGERSPVGDPRGTQRVRCRSGKARLAPSPDVLTENRAAVSEPPAAACTGRLLSMVGLLG
jgi:hypothetical protein